MFRTQEEDGGRISIHVTLETMGLQQLSRLLSKLEAIRGVQRVSRKRA
ncbi:MAG TPA: ACT domain-containing protein [Dehalococcoidia bacterium]|nr:ACT domain-containing protein [Dehalococcoidia bacterium]